MLKILDKQKKLTFCDSCNFRLNRFKLWQTFHCVVFIYNFKVVYFVQW